MNNRKERYSRLFEKVKGLYMEPSNKDKLLFHGWHHIKFVHDKSRYFAKDIGADVERVASAALVHDLNYVFSESLDPEDVVRETRCILVECGYDEGSVEKILNVIAEAHTNNRHGNKLSLEGKALSDGDTLFKALPITPILFSSKFLKETGYDLHKLADKIVTEQKPLLESGFYFYTEIAQNKYMKWAKINFKLWENIKESLQDEDTKEMLELAYEMDIL
jgi:uncharacterized protein